MHATDPATAAARLERLAGFLHQDPDNASLLADACDAALESGSHLQAETFLASARRLQLQAPEWQHRRAHLCLARGELDEARALLEALQARNGWHPALVHDLAYVHLLQGDGQGAHALLQPWADGDFDEPGMARDPLQALWLRTCHHLDRSDEGWQWVQRARASHTLGAGAAGVASLIALDREEGESARLLADVSLASHPFQHEALVTRGCLALAAGAPEEAAGFLERAVQRHGRDGRALSALGFAKLLARDLTAARKHLEAAVEVMADDAQTWHALGWTRLLEQDQAGALAAFRSALALDPEAADSRAAMGLALVLSGDAAGAEPFLGRAEPGKQEERAAGIARAILQGRLAPQDVQAWLTALPAQWSPRP